MNNARFDRIPFRLVSASRLRGRRLVLRGVGLCDPVVVGRATRGASRSRRLVLLGRGACTCSDVLVLVLALRISRLGRVGLLRVISATLEEYASLRWIGGRFGCLRLTTLALTEAVSFAGVGASSGFCCLSTPGTASLVRTPAFSPPAFLSIFSCTECAACLDDGMRR